MTEFTPWMGLLGGIMLGISASILLLFNGRITGISGFLGKSTLSKAGPNLWRIFFLIGLLIGTYIFRLWNNWQYQIQINAPILFILFGGFCVGFGTRLGSGCTSGHGICGNARFSARSLVATVLFFGFAIVTVWIVRHQFGRL